MNIELKLNEQVITTSMDIPAITVETRWDDLSLYLGSSLIGTLTTVPQPIEDFPDLKIYYFDSTISGAFEVGSNYDDLKTVQNLTLKLLQEHLIHELKEEIAMISLFTPK